MRTIRYLIVTIGVLLYGSFSFEYNYQHPSISPDGKTLYFASDMPGGKGESDIYKVTKEGSSWGKPVNLGDKINTEGNEGMPFFHKDGFLLFSSDGHVGLGGLDVFVSGLIGDEFEQPKNVGYPLNDSKDDFGFVVDNEMKKGYFSSNRPGGKGMDDIYYFDMLKPFEKCKKVNGFAKDFGGDVVPGAKVSVKNSEGEVVNSLVVGEDGSYEFCLPVGDYTIQGEKENYTNGTASISVSDKEIDQDVILKDNQQYTLVGDVVDTETKEALDGVKITFVDPVKKNEEVYTTTNGKLNESLSYKLNKGVGYQVKLEKEGYLTKNIVYNPVMNGPTQFFISSELLALEKGEGYVKDVIVINRIYFDLDKSNIRPDASVELDKIVTLMNNYPEMTIELRSYTDCRATNEYNKALSNRRANSTLNYIKKRIKNKGRITGRGYGESNPLSNCSCEEDGSSNCTEQEHQNNRRTEFKITNLGGAKVKNNSLSKN